jgi:uncharacterized protein (DUF2062 family)
MNIKAKIKELISRVMHHERSAHRLALSVCIGIFIALSPFLFFHTIMIIAVCWFLRLNFAFVYAIAHLINNPWTMIFIYATDHWIGHWLLSQWGATGLIAANPFWIEFFNHKLQTIGFFSGFSLWSFLVGGSLLAFGFSVMLYPVMKQFFKRWLRTTLTGTPE